jgi:hypothetical protein
MNSRPMSSAGHGARTGCSARIPTIPVSGSNRFILLNRSFRCVSPAGIARSVFARATRWSGSGSVRIRLTNDCSHSDVAAEQPTADVPTPRYAAGLGPFLSVAAIVLMAGTGALAGWAQVLKIDPLDQRCVQAADSVIVGTTCSACQCGVPVNRATRLDYEVQLTELCRDYSGPVCRYRCATPFAICRDGTCVLSAAP